MLQKVETADFKKQPTPHRRFGQASRQGVDPRIAFPGAPIPRFPDFTLTNTLLLQNQGSYEFTFIRDGQHFFK